MLTAINNALSKIFSVKIQSAKWLHLKGKTTKPATKKKTHIIFKK